MRHVSYALQRDTPQASPPDQQPFFALGPYQTQPLQISY